MPDKEYDIAAAHTRHKYIMEDLVAIKNVLKKEIEYYYERSPQSANEELEQQRVIKKAISRAQELMHALLNGKSINW